MKQIDVVAGIIFSKDRSAVLLGLRKPNQHQGDRWEFPGGKLESGESQEDALRRELQEEVAITAHSLVFRRRIEHTYSDKAVCLHFWDVLSFTGDASGREGQRLKWVPCAELDQYDFPAANQAIVEELCQSGALARSE